LDGPSLPFSLEKKLGMAVGLGGGMRYVRISYGVEEVDVQLETWCIRYSPVHGSVSSLVLLVCCLSGRVRNNFSVLMRRSSICIRRRGSQASESTSADTANGYVQSMGVSKV
jgi:hypothetical protein